MSYRASLKITTYSNHIILTILDKGPKVRSIGIGTQLIGFHSADLLMSQDALDIFSSRMSSKKEESPAIEIINPSNICWQSSDGMIVHVDEIINVYALPHHCLCANTVDPKIIETINSL